MNPKESGTALGSRASVQTAAAGAVRPKPERCKLNCAWNIAYIAKVSFCRGKSPALLVAVLSRHLIAWSGFDVSPRLVIATPETKVKSKALFTVKAARRASPKRVNPAGGRTAAAPRSTSALDVSENHTRITIGV